MYKKHLSAAMASLLILGSVGANAMQVFGDNSKKLKPKTAEGHLSLSRSDIDFDTDGGSSGADFDVLAAEYKYGYSNRIDVTAQLGYIYDITYPGGCDGDGFTLGAGASGFIARIQQIEIMGYGMLNYLVADNDCGGDFDVLSLHLGPVANYRVNDQITAFAGTEFIMLSDGSIDGGGDIEHDDVVNLNIGARGLFENFFWRAKASFLGEQSLTLSIGVPLR